MKTTIELADDLLLLAKQRALDEGTTLRALIEKGLRHALADAPGRDGSPQRYQFPVIRDALKSPDGGISDANVLIDAIREESLESALPGRPR